MIDKLITFVIGMIVGAVALFVALAIYAWWRNKRRGMKKFKIILKSGASFEVKCEHVTLKHIDNELTSYHFEEISEKYDYPLYIRIDEIVAVIELRKDGEE